MSDGNGRFACAVTVASQTRDQAETLFRENSKKIVQKARDNMSRGSQNRPLRLSFP
jgi:hypothetical protein